MVEKAKNDTTQAHDKPIAIPMIMRLHIGYNILSALLILGFGLFLFMDTHTYVPSNQDDFLSVVGNGINEGLRFVSILMLAFGAWRLVAVIASIYRKLWGRIALGINSLVLVGFMVAISDYPLIFLLIEFVNLVLLMWFAYQFPFNRTVVETDP